MAAKKDRTLKREKSRKGSVHLKNDYGESAATQVVSVCYFCEQPRSFVVSSVHELPKEGPPEEYTFAYCSLCKEPSVFYREDMGDGFASDSYYRLYPPQQRHITHSLPDVVRQSYDEAVRCESARTWTACVVMVGRTLEAVCKEFDPATRNIFKGLKSMFDKHLISQEVLEWANELRVLRNLGAHATREPIESRDAQGALDFLQAILEILYDLRPKFEDFKRRREADQTRKDA